jgi:RNA polymerase subunit RPABC4/transcription elongation factor Spt4
LILALLATLGALVVGFVLYPVFAEERRGALGESAEALALRDLEDKKARLYTAIKDLDFEKAAGKVSNEDYESARSDYLAQTAEVLAEIDRLGVETKTPKSEPKAESETSETVGNRVCSSCGETSREGAKFCIACGQAFEHACSQCGEALPPEAKFCPECGRGIGP